MNARKTKKVRALKRHSHTECKLHGYAGAPPCLDCKARYEKIPDDVRGSAP